METKNPSASFHAHPTSFTPPPVDPPLPSFGSTYGLTFQQARTAILQTLTEVCQECYGQHSPITYFDYRIILLVIVGLVIVSFYIASYALGQYPSSGSGLLFSIIVTGVAVCTNIIAILLYKKSYSVEVYQALQQVSKQYEYYVQRQLIQDYSEPDHTAVNPNHTLLPTGHSQISIVNTFRNGQWMKLPVLLLAEGDIIALLGGDVTPCRVVELKEQINLTGPNSTSSMYSSKNMEAMTWMEGEHFEHGVKIHIDEDLHRKHHHHHHHNHVHHHRSHSSKKSEFEYDREIRQKVTISSNVATADVPLPFKTNERHRTLDPESIEILRLCGNIRCFKLLETPMKEFVRKTYNTQCLIPQQRGGLFVHKLRRAVHQEEFSYGLYLLLLLFVVCLIRIFVAPNMLDKYGIALLVPMATTMILSAASALPILFMLIEAFGTAEILTTLEVAHHNIAGPSSAGSNPSKSTATNAATTKPPETKQEKNESSKKKHKHDAKESHDINDHEERKSQSSQPGDNEFVDDDIDARVEDIAEETATKVMYFRFFRYVMKVLWTRLAGGVTNTLGVDYANTEVQPLLPIPLARTNIVEQLGAITMVCFVDDDIVSENYSVTEEIFLLNDHQEFGKDSGAGSSNTSNPANMHSDKSKAGAGHGPTSNSMDMKFNGGLQKGMKSTVLDLHANPEATGSRFENPLWWKYLPCLKPLGLNALLTYKYTAERHSTSSTGPTSPTSTSGNSPMPPSNRPAYDIEKSLVQHIRKTLPLEFLRELAEEIGFVEDDVKNFTRALEVNVLAPGLENAHLLEDNHQWGQEESRRRGSLLPQLRGAIYRDVRGGSLQMMSLGDPTLVLHYCREYWDGNTCSIVPLSHADRTEVLSVYERWRLEDFDVVAFAYTPMPMFAMQYLLDVAPNNLNAGNVGNTGLSGGGSRKRSSSQAMTPNSSHNNITTNASEGKSPTWFFVDPSSVQDLNGGKGRSKDNSVSGSLKSTASGATIHPGFGKTSLEASEEIVDTENNDEKEEFLDVDGKSGGLTRDGSTGGVKRSVTINHLPTIPDEDGEEEHQTIRSSAKKEETYSAKSRRIKNEAVLEAEGVDMLNTTTSILSPDSSGNSAWTTIKRSMSDSNLLLKSNATTPISPSSQKLKQVATSGDLVSSETNYLVMPYEITQSVKTERISLAASSVFSAESNPDLSPSNMSSASHFFPITMESNSMKTNITATTPPRLHLPAVGSEDVIGLATPVSLIKSLSLEDSMLQNNPSRPRRRSCSHSDVMMLAASNVDFDPAATSASAMMMSGSSSTRVRRTSSTTLPLADDLLLRRGSGNSPIPQIGLDLQSLQADSTTQRDSFSSTNNQGAAVPRGGSPLMISTSEKTRRSSSTSQVVTQVLAATSAPSSRKVHRDRQQNSFFKSQRRSALKQLWTLMRQQIFLGMAASSVPVRKDVPNMKEDLDAAGIRFVYFSPQNMKRSKPVAEKIGIPFDWNCAISLRILDSDQHDPHRHISSYADWDVLARMPHGIEAIKQHIKTVDNVPLLVSLFTDATPDTIQQMIGIFRENDEVVLAIGSGYRAYNQSIFCSANISSSVSTLPNVMSFIPAQEQDLLDQFPTASSCSLTKSDLQLSFDLVSLGSINLLQGHSFYRHMKSVATYHNVEVKKPESEIEHLQLSVLLETIRKGRVLLLNEIQALAFLVITGLGLSLWPLLAHVIPVSVPVTCPPPMAIIFVLIYLPCIGLSMIFSDDHEGVMKTTPRKSSFVRKPKDQSRFYQYLATRVFTIIFSIIITGYFTAASVFQASHQSYLQSLSHYHEIFQSDSTMETVYHARGFWLVQDMMCHAALLSVVAQSFSLLSRGQQFWNDFPWPRYYQEYYAILLVIFIVHACIMAWRAGLRGCSISHEATAILVGEDFCDASFREEDIGEVKYRYASLHFVAYLVLFVSSIALNMLSGFWINVDDRYHYRRYLQFLRLEFDTRLGMHSPR